MEQPVLRSRVLDPERFSIYFVFIYFATDTERVQFIKFNRLETNSIFLRAIYLFLSTRILFFFIVY